MNLTLHIAISTFFHFSLSSSLPYASSSTDSSSRFVPFPLRIHFQLFNSFQCNQRSPFTSYMFCFLLHHARAQKLATRLIFGKGNADIDLRSDERRKKLGNSRNQLGNVFIIFPLRFLLSMLRMMNPGLPIRETFGWGLGLRSGQIKRPSMIDFLLKLKAVYMYAAGFYSYSIFALIFWETRRSDFGVSMSHHVATVILIVLSYIFRFARVGSVVLALHDASDVFLEIGKMSKYSGAETVASFAFILFVLSWIILRLIYYPFWILWSTRTCSSAQELPVGSSSTFNVEDMEGGLSGGFGETGNELESVPREMCRHGFNSSKTNQSWEEFKTALMAKFLPVLMGDPFESLLTLKHEQAMAKLNHPIQKASERVRIYIDFVRAKGVKSESGKVLDNEWGEGSVSYEVLLTLDKEKHRVDGPVYYYLFNSLLYCLLVMHIYWWVLIFRMLVKQIQARGKVSEDVRSDSEDEHED
ncbi:hypothetical protein ACSQ67_007952 [Phaseolus vulgaris]